MMYIAMPSVRSWMLLLSLLAWQLPSVCGLSAKPTGIVQLDYQASGRSGTSLMRKEGPADDSSPEDDSKADSQADANSAQDRTAEAAAEAYAKSYGTTYGTGRDASAQEATAEDAPKSVPAQGDPNSDEDSNSDKGKGGKGNKGKGGKGNNGKGGKGNAGKGGKGDNGKGGKGDRGKGGKGDKGKGGKGDADAAKSVSDNVKADAQRSQQANNSDSAATPASNITLPPNESAAAFPINPPADPSGKNCQGHKAEQMCEGKGDKLVDDPACWSCFKSYRIMFCEKNALVVPAPVWIEKCAHEKTIRNVYCSKFAEVDPPVMKEKCFFKDANYKEMFCDKSYKTGFNKRCAVDEDIGVAYCKQWGKSLQGFAVCNQHPSFMYEYCDKKANSTIFDPACATHKTVGQAFCTYFVNEATIRTECVPHEKYMLEYCGKRAMVSDPSPICATDERTSDSYCNELAMKKEQIQACWAVRNFPPVYCKEVAYADAKCLILQNATKKSDDGENKTSKASGDEKNKSVSLDEKNMWGSSSIRSLEKASIAQESAKQFGIRAGARIEEAKHKEHTKLRPFNPRAHERALWTDSSGLAPPVMQYQGDGQHVFQGTEAVP